MPAGYRFCTYECCDSSGYDEWNKALAQYKHLFDAVTIHDYTACAKSIDTRYSGTNRRQALLSWGEVQLADHATYVSSFFGDKEIWMTEWSYASWEGYPLIGDDDGNGGKFTKESVPKSVLSGIYHSSFMLAAVGRSMADQTRHTTAHHHLLSEQSGNGWGANAGYIRAAADASDAEINGAGQVFSHVSWLALAMSDTWATVRVSNSPKIGVKVETKELNCIYAAAFEHSCRTRTPPAYAIINRCQNTHKVTLDIRTTKRRAQSTTMETTTYSSSATSDWTPIGDIRGAQGGTGSSHPWTKGPIDLSSAVQTTTLPSKGTTVDISVAKLSMAIVNFADAQDYGKNCPTFWRSS